MKQQQEEKTTKNNCNKNKKETQKKTRVCQLVQKSYAFFALAAAAAVAVSHCARARVFCLFFAQSEKVRVE